MAWSKFTPNEPAVDPNASSDPSAARRAMVLKWGWWISQAMFFAGLLLILYWGFLR